MLLPLLLSLSTAPDALRWNLLGYPPSGRAKTVLAVSDSSLEGHAWRAVGPDGTVLTGVLGAGREAGEGQSPWSFHHGIDLSAARLEGSWALAVEGLPAAAVDVRLRPWDSLTPKALHHLATVRSGAAQVVEWRKPSHRGDSASPVWVPDRESEVEGSWSAAGTGRTLRVAGGWYDAGDYLKFTLTTAGATWSLLRAWEAWPEGPDAPALLAEARHGLEYLLQLFPDDTTFVIQVGNGRDHSQGSRLPEMDRLEGRRPALVELSPAHMGLTAAALALGARAFATTGGSELADTCARLAVRTLAAAAQAPRREVFYHDETNDFYRDASWYDNLALGAAETWKLTGDSAWRARALTWLDSAGQATWASWGDWELAAAGRLAAEDPKAMRLLRAGLDRFVRWSRGAGAPWGVPLQQGWAPFDGYTTVAAEALEHATLDTAYARLAWDVWDYMAGPSNWGVSFVVDSARAGSVRNLYSQIHPLSGRVGTGALAEGPGSATEHADLVQWFDIPTPSPEDVFNTASVVFYDNATDFQTMETTIGIQGNFLRLLAVMGRATEDSANGFLGVGAVDRAAGRLSVRAGRIAWELPVPGPARLRLVDAAGRSTLLGSGAFARCGSLEVPRFSGLRWAVLESAAGRSVLALPSP